MAQDSTSPVPNLRREASNTVTRNNRTDGGVPGQALSPDNDVVKLWGRKRHRHIATRRALGVQASFCSSCDCF